MKKMIAMLLVVAFVSVNLVGCSGSTASTTKTSTSTATGDKGKDSGSKGGK
jgi:hypothetical protein